VCGNGAVAGAEVTAAAIFAAPFVLILGLLARDWFEARRWQGEEDGFECWTCATCGYHVEASSIEGVLEGMRIHDIATSCSQEDTDE